MTLEQVRAMPWYEHDAIMEGLASLPYEGADGDIDLSTDEGLAEAGITVRKVGGDV